LVAGSHYVAHFSLRAIVAVNHFYMEHQTAQ